MALAVPKTVVQGLAIYNLTPEKSLPEWYASTKKKGNLRHNEDFRRRIELIQGFEFPGAATRVKYSPNGKFIAACGVYPPQIKMFDLSELSEKFERHLDSEIIQFQVPRDIAYYPASCDVYIAATGSQLYRLNLDVGRFLKPIDLPMDDANVVKFSPYHYLAAVGGAGGIVSCIDPRARSIVGNVDTSIALKASGVVFDDIEVSALRFHDDGVYMAVGTSVGHTLLYDIRSSKPLVIKDQGYDDPVIDIKFHHYNNSRLVMTADKHVIRMWNKDTGATVTSLETDKEINDVCVSPDSGLVLVGGMSYFIPALGPAPKWCSFLDGITEELDEKKSVTVYDDYRFVTPNDLQTLGLTHLIGTDMLRAHMHGYFVSAKLYEKAKAVANPEAYAEYRKRKVQEQLEKERESRISIKKKLPKVNKELALKLSTTKKRGGRDSDSEDEKTKTSKKDQTRAAILKDKRFAGLFSDEDFQIDSASEAFRLLHPDGPSKPREVEEDEEPEDDEQQEDDGENFGDDDCENDGEDNEMDVDEEDDEMDADDDDDDQSISDEAEKAFTNFELADKSDNKLKMFRLKEGAVLGSRHQPVNDVDFKDRVASLPDEAPTGLRKRAIGGMSVTFTDHARYDGDDDSDEERDRPTKRRERDPAVRARGRGMDRGGRGGRGSSRGDRGGRGGRGSSRGSRGSRGGDRGGSRGGGFRGGSRGGFRGGRGRGGSDRGGGGFRGSRGRGSSRGGFRSRGGGRGRGF